MVKMFQVHDGSSFSALCMALDAEMAVRKVRLHFPVVKFRLFATEIPDISRIEVAGPIAIYA